jgi:pimeloyl-ACP methyl ester carboxylesterase
MTGIRRWRTYGDGRYGQIHIRCAEPANGPGAKVPVVCFHPSPSSGATFALFQPAMAADRLVLCPDTPGFGGSDFPPGPVSIPDYAGAMADLLDSMGFGAERGPVDVVGTHTGSLIGAALAAARPDLVRRLALPSLALLNEQDRAKLKAMYGGVPPLLTDPDAVPKIWKQTVIDGPKAIAADRRMELFAERMRVGTRSWYGPEASLNFDCDAVLRKVQQPVLLLILDEMLGPNTRRAEPLLKNPTVVDISDRAGHDTWDTGPEIMAQPMRAFFDAA